MTTSSEILLYLQAFANLVNGNAAVERLVKGWDRTIQIRASDLDADFWIRVVDRKMSILEGGELGRPDLKIETTGDHLVRIFTGQVSSAELLADGSIRVGGPQKDQMKLDAVAQALWP